MSYAIMKEKATALQVHSTNTKKLYEELEAKTKAGQEPTAEESNKLEAMIEDGKKIRGEFEKAKSVYDLYDLANAPDGERKSREGFEDGRPQRRKSWGEITVSSSQFTNNNGEKMERVGVKSVFPRGRKALYGSDDGQGGYLVPPDRQPEMIDIIRRRPLSIMDLISRKETTRDSVEYVEQTVRTNRARVVPERRASGSGFEQKPESDIGFNMKQAAVKTIATWIAASRTILADAPQLRDLIDDELAYMVEIELENQVLTGDGLGNNFTGILSWPGIQTRTQGNTSDRGGKAGDTMADTIRRAITDIRLEFYEATGVLLSPEDSEKLELLKDSENRYLNIYDPVAQRVWRVPVAESPAIPALTGMVGNFRLAATLWDRMNTEIRVGEPYGFFLENAVAILAELRAAFAVVRPRALEKVTFTA